MKKRLLNILIVFLVAGLLPGVAFATSFETLPTSNFANITSKDGLIWVTRNTGVVNYYWNGSNWIAGETMFPSGSRIPSDGIRDTFIDDQARLWFSGGRSYSNKEHVTGYIPMTSQGKNVNYYGYQYFTRAKNGTIWTYGFPDGDNYRYPTVAYFTGEDFVNLPVNAPFSLSQSCLTVDHNGRPWISGSGQGDYNKVAYWNGSSWVRCDPPLPGACTVRALATASDGSIVAFGIYGTSQSGWAVYKNGVWTLKESSTNSTAALPVAYDYNIESGPDGKIWARAYGAGNGGRLTYYENETWKKTIPAPFGIVDFTVDNSGIVWAIGNSNKVAAFIEGTWYTDTDSFSAKLIEAAKKSADAAKVSADAAAANTGAAVTAAQGAKASADTAASRAQTAVNQTVDAGTSAASWAHQSYDKANQASLDATYIRIP